MANKTNQLFKALLFMFLVFSAWESCAHAGAWGKEKGKSLHLLQHSLYTTHHIFDDYGDIERFQHSGRFTKQQLNYYVEYGVHDKWTLIGNFFYDWLEFHNNFSTSKTDGLSDQELAVQYQLKRGKHAWAVQEIVKFPAYARQADPSLGNQQVDFETRFLYGYTFKMGRNWAYLNLEAGYRFRTEEPADQIRYQILFGYRPTLRSEWIVAVDGIEGMRNGKITKTSNNVTVDPDLSLIKARTELILPLYRDHVFLQTSFFWHVLGRNTGGGWGFQNGVRFVF